MAYITKVAYHVADTATAVTEIKNRMADMGWTVHDDMYTADDYYVMKSISEAADEMPFYVQIAYGVTANKLTIRAFAWWNNTTHVGTCRLGASDSYHYLNADDDNNFYLWIYGNKDWVSIITKTTTVYQSTGFGKVKRFWDVEGVLQSNVTLGNNVVLTLAAGEVNDFLVGRDYQIVGENGEGRQPVTVNAKNPSSNTITLTSLAYDFDANSRIGQTPYPWMIRPLHTASYSYWLRQQVSGTVSDPTANYIGNDVFAVSYVDPDYRANQSYVMFPWTLREYNSWAMFGYIDELCLRGSGPATYEDTYAVEVQVEGDVSAASSNTITDTTQAWTSNEFVDKAVIITAGIGVGQVRKISSNTGTEITVSANWSTQPDNTSEYIVSNEAWRYFYFGGTANSCCFLEV